MSVLFVYFTEIPSDQVQYKVTSLRNQYDLQFRIYAQNKAGKSKPVQLADSVRLIEAPGRVMLIVFYARLFI